MDKPKVLIIYNDSLYHKGSVKSIFWRDVLMEDGFDVERVGDVSPIGNRDVLKQYDLILMSWSEDQLHRYEALNLIDAVGFEGVGLAGYHETSTAFRQYHWHWMFGSFMATHPGYAANGWQHTYTVHITKPDDPIMRGIKDFEHHSEQFYLLHDGDNFNEVLAETTMTESDYPWMVGKVSPVVYKRPWGSGKIFYSTLGHYADEFKQDEAFKIMHRGMIWASRRLPDGLSLEDI